MNPKLLEKYQKQSNIMKSLAHPTRMFIVEFLSEKERCVCEIVEQVGVDISTISKHLSLLKQAGLISSVKRGLNVYYKLECPCVLKMFECVKNIS